MFIEYRQQRDDAYHAILTRAEAQARSEVTELERLIQLVQQSADEVATAVSERRLGSGDYDQTLVDMLQSEQLFYGAAIAFTPYIYEDTSSSFRSMALNIFLARYHAAPSAAVAAMDAGDRYRA